ncbi:hypothetical protein BDW71DRAFT_204805 [Aspergillus fruticulosus]
MSTSLESTSTDTSAIDTTSLATSPLERRNSLEKHLLTRPDPKDLKDRHILLDTNVAPYVQRSSLPFSFVWAVCWYTDDANDVGELCRSIQAMRQKLDRQQVSDNLKKNLEHRPEREELVERAYSVYYSLSPWALVLSFFGFRRTRSARTAEGVC